MNPQTNPLTDRSGVIELDDTMYEGYVELMRELHEEFSITKTMRFDEERVANLFQNVLVNTGFGAFVCFDFETKQMLGILIAGTTALPTSSDLIASCTIFYVVKKWRDGFVAKSLLTYYKAWAKKKGAHVAFVHSVKDMAAPNKILNAAGWKNVGTEMMVEIE